jgi:hypothetical protein
LELDLLVDPLDLVNVHDVEVFDDVRVIMSIQNVW